MSNFFELKCHSDEPCPFIGDELNFMLMHDNARPHIANVVNVYLNEVEIRRMIWSARSPDMNPIEHVWDMINKKKIKARIPAPADLRELGAAVIQEWDEVDQADIYHLIEGMPRRMAAVIQARGGNTQY